MHNLCMEEPIVSRVVKSSIEATEVCIPVVPGWQSLSPSSITVTELSGGITNRLFLCTPPNSAPSALVRVFGNKSEVLIDRQREIRFLRLLAKKHIAPPLFARTGNGIIYGYTEGNIPSSSKAMGSPELIVSIANQLRMLHSIPIPQEANPCLFTVLSQWLKKAEDGNYPPDRQSRIPWNSWSDLREELNVLRQKVEELGPWRVTLCHNDLLSGNMVVRDDGRVTFIDYEYANYNYSAFDIGNHFCEYAGFECEYGNLPTVEEKKVFLDTYNEGVDNVTVEQVGVMMLCSHWWWGLWGLVQSCVSQINFDFFSYGLRRLEEYFKSSR